MGALGQKLIPLWWKGRRHRRSGSSESSRNSSSSKIISSDGGRGRGRGDGRGSAGEAVATPSSPSSPQQQQQQRHRLHDTPLQEAPSRTVPPLLSATHQTPQYRHTPTHHPLPAPTYSSSSASATVPKPQESKSNPRHHTGLDEGAVGGAWRSWEVPEGVQQASMSYPRGSPRPDSVDHHQLQQQQQRRRSEQPSSGLGARASGLSSPLAASPPPQQQLRWGRVASVGTPSPLPTAPAAPPTPPAGNGLSAFDDCVANSTSATAGQPLNSLPSSLPTVSVSGGSLQSNVAATTYYGAYQRSVHGGSGSGGVDGGGAARGATPSLRASYSPLQLVTPHRTVPVAAAPPPPPQQQQQQPESGHCPPVLPRVASRRPGDGQRTPSDIASNTVCAPARVDCTVPLQAPLPRARNVPFHSSNSRTRNQQQQQQYVPTSPLRQREDLWSGSARDEPVVEGSEDTKHAPRLTRELLERYQRAHPTAAAPTRVVPELDTPPKNSRHDLPQPPRQRRHSHQEARASPAAAAAAPVDHDPQPYLTNPRYAMEQRRALQATQPRAPLVEEVRESVSPVRRPPLLSSPVRGRERAGTFSSGTKPSSPPPPPPAVSASHPASAGRVAAAGPIAGRAGDLLRGTAVRRAASPAAVSPSSFSPQPGMVQRHHAHSPSPVPVAPTNYSSGPRQQQQQRATGAAAGVALPAVSRPVVYPQHHRGAGRYAATPLAHANGHYGAHGSTVQQGGPLPPLLHPAMYGLRSDDVPTQEPPRTWLKPELEAAGEERSAGGRPGQQQQLQRASSLLRGLRAEKEQRQGRRGNFMR